VIAGTRTGAQTRSRARRPVGRPAAFLALVVLTLLFSLPTIWLVLTSLKPEAEYASYPITVLFAELGLLNSYWPWVLWGAHGSAFHIFLFRQFFAAIPRDLEDAAEVDGCGKFRIFWQIFLPNSLPAVCASAIFAFTWVWGDWLLPKLFLTDQITTLAVKLATAYVDPVQGMAIVTVTVAGVALYVLPMIVVFFLAQRYIIQGVVTSGLKG
jgi:ABC-type glycerol-3-phosphate transport system permease component